MLKDQIVNKILETIKKLLKTVDNMYKLANEKKYSNVEEIAKDIIVLLKEISPIAKKIKEKIPYISAPITCENLIYSLNNIIRLTKVHSERVVSKIEFELIPILKEFEYDFYFFTCVFGDEEKEKEHYKNEFVKMGANSYIDESIKKGYYKYDVSIYVLAYNKLEYTMHCVESIIKYTPSYINYELFLLNNGSNDGTKEYFESFKCNKEIHLLKNCISDIRAARRICEGRYVLSVSNDIIVTENYLTNLIKCMESDPKIAMIVPATPNVSNQQTIPAEYSNLQEMHVFAKANNISDPKRWEERTRLCNPITFFRSDVILSSNGVGLVDKYFVYSEFGDDALALRLRRAGYKLILAKDCYCYHFGSVTLREAQKKDNTLEKSRALFIKRHDIDAWSTGFCYDNNLMRVLELKQKEHIRILGINSGFGSNPLKIKTLHKEAGFEDIELFFTMDDERYIPDLKAYSSNVEYNIDPINTFDDKLFDYIILESNTKNIIKTTKDIEQFKNKLEKDGILAIAGVNQEEIEILNTLEANKIIEGYICKWYIW